MTVISDEQRRSALLAMVEDMQRKLRNNFPSAVVALGRWPDGSFVIVASVGEDPVCVFCGRSSNLGLVQSSGRAGKVDVKCCDKCGPKFVLALREGPS